jgi:hypothetical protein
VLGFFVFIRRVATLLFGRPRAFDPVDIGLRPLSDRPLWERYRDLGLVVGGFDCFYHFGGRLCPPEGVRLIDSKAGFEGHCRIAEGRRHDLGSRGRADSIPIGDRFLGAFACTIDISPVVDPDFDP